MKNDILGYKQSLINAVEDQMEDGTPFPVYCLETLRLWMKKRGEGATFEDALEILATANKYGYLTKSLRE